MDSAEVQRDQVGDQVRLYTITNHTQLHTPVSFLRITTVKLDHKVSGLKATAAAAQRTRQGR